VLLKAGTLGAGLDVSKSISERLAVRLQANALNYNHDTTRSDVDYKAELELSLPVCFSTGIRSAACSASAAALIERQQGYRDRQPTGGTYEINGQTYNSTDIGSLNEKITFRALAPYLGVGFGSAPKADGG